MEWKSAKSAGFLSKIGRLFRPRGKKPTVWNVDFYKEVPKYTGIFVPHSFFYKDGEEESVKAPNRTQSEE